MILKKSKNRRFRSLSKTGSEITEHVSTVAMQDRRTINSELYITDCFPLVFQKICQKRSRGRIILHQNVRAHAAARTNGY